MQRLPNGPAMTQENLHTLLRPLSGANGRASLAGALHAGNLAGHLRLGCLALAGCRGRTVRVTQ
jgi:hypothetical protein